VVEPVLARSCVPFDSQISDLRPRGARGVGEIRVSVSSLFCILQKRLESPYVVQARPFLDIEFMGIDRRLAIVIISEVSVADSPLSLVAKKVYR